MSPLRPSDPSPGFCAVSEIAAHSLEWLWPQRLPKGKLAILEGDPGLGKSLLALDLCARLSTGRPWPDDAAAAAPAACVYLNGEDGEADTLRPRLLALGADPARVFVRDRDEDGLPLPLSLPDQTDALARVVIQCGARLVVIDPVMAFFGPSVNPSSNQSIRRALDPLVALAAAQGCTILLIRHLNKRGGDHALYRGLGAIGLVGVCRSAWLVAEDPEDGRRRVLAQVKNNLAVPQPSLAFEVVPAEGGAPALNWLGPLPLTADDLLTQGRRRGRQRRERGNAFAFLAQLLAAGPLPVREVWERATQEGLSRATLRRAKGELEIRSQMVTVDGKRVSYWLLPTQQAPAGGSPDEDPNSLEPWLAPLRERYPSPTPLDDL